MAVNKNALILYQVLDKCFRNPGRKYFWKDLVEACNLALQELDGNSKGIQRRQLFDDIRFMESEQGWSVPLERFRYDKKTYYRYSNLNFSINNQPINEVEAQQIKSALSLLSRFKGMPQFEWVNEIIPKFEQSLHLKPVEQEVISFDSNEYLKGVTYLGELFNAIIYKKVILISYKSFKSEIIFEFEIHPYYLKQYNNRWFLFGHNPKVEKLTNLALDRIEGIKELVKPYIENTTVNFQEYFEDIIGVTRPENGELTEIKLQFAPDQAPYILTKPLHGSQKKINLSENGVTISIEVVPNYELEKLILFYGESVVVLSPESFKVKIIDRIDKMVEKYGI